MSESRKYGVGALFIFPLVGDGVNDFVSDYTPAAGDAKVWTDKLISTNLTSLILGFDSLSELPTQGDTLEENGAGTAEGIVEFTIIVSGTVGGGDAAGFFIMRSVTGQAWSNDDQIDINGGTANIATADSTTYDLAATAGLIGEIGNKLFAAALSPTEMSCSQGGLLIVDSATKAIEDQAILFTTFGNANALQAMDLDDGNGSTLTEAGGDGDHLTKVAVVLTGLDAVLKTSTFALAIADAIWDEILSGGTHNIATSAGRRLRGLQDFGQYEGGAVWIDTANGTAGTVDFENGTVDNPVDSITDALTIANSVGLARFHILPGSSITLAASVAGFEFAGFGYAIVLNAKNISGCLFENAMITGNDSGSNAVRVHFHECAMNSNSLGMHMLRRCGLGGDIILTEGGVDYFWDQCYSQIAGTGTPSVDFESAAETKNMSIRHYSGGIEIRNHGAGSGVHQTSIEGHGQIVIAASCVGDPVIVRGHFKITQTGTVTLDERVNFESLLDDGTATYDRLTDSLQEIRDHATTIKSETALIVADTNELQGDDVPGLIAAVQADLPSSITKNVELAAFPFLLVDSTDHVTPKTGRTVTATRSIDGGAFGACANAVAEVASGWYKITLAASDLNGNTIALRFTATASDDRNITIVTQPT